MAIEITVPRLGWSMEEGIFGGWLKRPGELVQAGEPLFALESDKVTMDVEALDTGILHEPKTLAAGDIVLPGQLLGYLLAAGELLPSRELPAGKAEIAVSPRARAAARAAGVELSQIKPRPGKARIVAADVAAVADVARMSSSRTVSSRATLAHRLESSFRAPHFYLHADADAEALVRYRHERRPLAYNDLLIKAIALALTRHPRVNAYWSDGTGGTGGTVLPRITHHIALAAQLGEQLLTPVLRNPAEKSLAQITAERLAILERCQQGQARPEDFADASATLSNLGPFGVDRFEAILNSPQSVIVAAGSIRKRPVVHDDAVVARLTLPLSLSVDHRVVDGVAAAAFLQTLVAILEQPGTAGADWA